MSKDKVIFIVGPTAVGKSAAAYALAACLPSPEIVSCDSAQVYREIRIASNRPSAEIMQRFPHHLVGFLPVAERFDVFQFNQRAASAVAGILERGGFPLVVGGSGLYMKVLLDGIFDGEEADLELRARLFAEVRAHGGEHLHRKLQGLDPEAAGKIHPNDVKKMVRAMEVCLVEDRPISDKQREECRGVWETYDIRLVGIREDREQLYARINARVEEMFEEGIVEEVRRLKGCELSASAAGLIGLREVFDYLDGAVDLAGAKELMKRNTRRFAKRQMTWFRKESRIRWVERRPGMEAEDLAQAVREAAGI